MMFGLIELVAVPSGSLAIVSSPDCAGTMMPSAPETMSAALVSLRFMVCSCRISSRRPERS